MEKLEKFVAESGSLMAGMSQYYNEDKNEITFCVRQQLPRTMRYGFLRGNSANDGEIKGTMHGHPESILAKEDFIGFYPKNIKTAAELIKWVKENPCDTKAFDWPFKLVKVYDTKPSSENDKPFAIKGVLNYAHPTNVKPFYEAFTCDTNFTPDSTDGILVYQNIDHVDEDVDCPRVFITPAVVEKMPKKITAEQFAQLEKAMVSAGDAQ